ncbi:hypothetical protein UC34_21085 [Pandoraea vervacti]|uniref:mRNA interferase n=1 Tax=Pandoraea vervacti TaxID=656178 RepID=A0ABN4FU51_9BURK|nr:hypothetical protein UC34_21085 [Pandoraea vervacti]
MVRRGEVWVASFDPAVGSEIKKTRPCVIVSPSAMHKGLQTVIVVPLTSSMASRYSVPTMFAGRPGAMQLSHLKSLDRRRLVRRSGALDRGVMRDAMAQLRDVFTEAADEAGE